MQDARCGIRDAGKTLSNLGKRLFDSAISPIMFVAQLFCMNYKDLEIWQLARELVIEIHAMALTLPKIELFEEGQQIRKSSKNVKATIVEGFGRRRYKNDYIKFLTYSHASNDETIDHLENLYETKSLQDEERFNYLKNKLDVLGRKINKFIQSVELNHISVK